MSQFDPEKVEHYEPTKMMRGPLTGANFYYRQYVKAIDYDNLLGLYRAQAAEIQRLSQSQEQLLANGEWLAEQLEKARELLGDIRPYLDYWMGWQDEQASAYLKRLDVLAPKAESEPPKVSTYLQPKHEKSANG